MADRPEKDEKTEAPTQRRKDEAKKKGERLASRELATAIAGIAGAMWIWIFAGPLSAEIKAATTSALTLTRADVIDFRPITALAVIVRPMLYPIIALFAIMLVGALVGQGMTGGLGFSTEAWNFKGSRINPLAGIKRILGPRGLIELAKAFLKASVLISLSAILLMGSINILVNLPRMPFEAAIQTIGSMGRKLMLWLSLGLAIIAAVDLPVQIYQWLQKMRMTKKEVKDEHKDQEGSPETRAAIRRAQEAIKQSGRKAIEEATVVLINPTHFAVALRYDPDKDSAPIVVGRGRGALADAIREAANEHGITILSYPSVARAIYFTGKVGQMIRPDLYVAVATILAFVMRIGAMQGPAPDVEAPETALFDEFGRPQ